MNGPSSEIGNGDPNSSTGSKKNAAGESESLRDKSPDDYRPINVFHSIKFAGDFRQTLGGWYPDSQGSGLAHSPLLGSTTSPDTAASAQDLGTACQTLKAQFDRVFFIFGLRRSGNHAILEWLRGHFPEEATLHLNSAELDTFQVLPDGAIKFDQGKYSSVRPREEQRICFIGYENLDVRQFSWLHNSGIAHRADLILLLRDFPNMAASIVKSAYERPSFVFEHRFRDLPGQWADYAMHHLNPVQGIEYVRFNDWFSSEAYRRNLSDRLGITHSDRGLNRVSEYGRGSSFDGLGMNGRAQDMDVLGRWRAVLDEPLFQFLLLANEKNLTLNHELFGNFPYSYSDILKLWRRQEKLT